MLSCPLVCAYVCVCIRVKEIFKRTAERVCASLAQCSSVHGIEKPVKMFGRAFRRDPCNRRTQQWWHFHLFRCQSEYQMYTNVHMCNCVYTLHHEHPVLSYFFLVHARSRSLSLSRSLSITIILHFSFYFDMNTKFKHSSFSLILFRLLLLFIRLSPDRSVGRFCCQCCVAAFFGIISV